MGVRQIRIALLAAAGGALLVPAALPAAAPPATPPVAHFTATPNPVVVGKRVRLDASGSTGTIVQHLWDLDGNGTYETGTARSWVWLRPEKPGTVRVHLRVVDDRGATADAIVPVTATPKRERAKPKPKARSAPRAAPRHSGRRHRTVVTTAGAGSVTIKNFAFGPKSLSISVGDTVTWTNQDTAQHTATANDGSFNTGTLSKGQSGSHTFTKAGTFAYICAIHPFMKGTIVVQGSSSGGGGSTSSGGGGSTGGGSSGGSAGTSGSGSTSTGTSGSTTSGQSADTGPGLPHTGLQLGAVALLGAAMVAAGAALRRLTRLERR